MTEKTAQTETRPADQNPWDERFGALTFAVVERSKSRFSALKQIRRSACKGVIRPRYTQTPVVFTTMSSAG
jgi:hypothetical protein